MSSPSSETEGGALYIGLMSGTSVDAIDSAIIDCRGDNTSLVATREHPIPSAIKSRIAQLSHSGQDEIEHMGRLDRDLGLLFSEAVTELLRTAQIARGDILAIGSHGQTIRHRPPSAAKCDETCFTLQIGDPNTIAEHTGITTVADFRRRDIAAGGEGAPLAPAFHAAAFADAQTNRGIVNIGGIANASILAGKQLLMGFDTGPGNTLLDHWVMKHQATPYDRDGAWGAEGTVDQQLMETLMEHPFLSVTGPRSTGKEAFNASWLDNCLAMHREIKPGDVQATLAEYTAKTIAAGLANCGLALDEVFICGGGAHNTDLMRRLYRHLTDTTLESTTALGMDPDWVEAAAFGWLAKQTMNGLPGNSPAVTGADGTRVLGGIYPGGPEGR